MLAASAVDIARTAMPLHFAANGISITSIYGSGAVAFIP